jgi:hypothetical protein
VTLFYSRGEIRQYSSGEIQPRGVSQVPRERVIQDNEVSDHAFDESPDFLPRMMY